METNLTGPFVMSQACIPFMKADPARYLHGRGHNGSVQAVLDDPARQQNLKAPQGDAGACIINISSFRARQSQPNCEGYAASKAGLLGLTHAIAVSGAQWGIRGGNAILPGYINVKHECKSGDEEGQPWAHNVKEERHLQHLVGRIGCGDDIAMTVEWLMNAGFVSGEEIVVDGGVSRSNTKLLDMVFNRLYHHMALKRMKMVSLTAMQYHQPFRVRFNVVDGSLSSPFSHSCYAPLPIQLSVVSISAHLKRDSSCQQVAAEQGSRTISYHTVSKPWESIRSNYARMYPDA